jgi:uncharacterized protein
MKIERSIEHFAVVWRGLAVRALVARVLQLVIPMLLAMLAGVTEAKELDPAFASHVTDSAHVMGAQAAAVDSKLKAFEAATGHQVFVLTVQTTGSQSIDEYAVEVFQKWKIGRARIDDGVLFVVAVADRKMRIEVGYGLEGTLTDAQCSRIIHEVVVPRFAHGEYAVGIEAGVDSILRTLAPPSALTVPNDNSPDVKSSDPSASERDGRTGWDAVVAVAVVMMLFVFVSSICSGFVGLFIIGMIALVLSNTQIAAAIVAIWLCGRWFLIAKNVREYHLARSTNHFLTWLWVFFAPGSGRPLAKGEKRFFTFSFSFDTSGSSDSSSSDDSDCGGGGGGRSGGAGASGGW